jgi:hypothetical protein
LHLYTSSVSTLFLAFPRHSDAPQEDLRVALEVIRELGILLLGEVELRLAEKLTSGPLGLVFAGVHACDQDPVMAAGYFVAIIVDNGHAAKCEGSMEMRHDLFGNDSRREIYQN